MQAQLDEVRNSLSALRSEVTAHNPQVRLPEQHRQVALYVGQCQLDRETEATSSSPVPRAAAPAAREDEERTE